MLHQKKGWLSQEQLRDKNPFITLGTDSTNEINKNQDSSPNSHQKISKYHYHLKNDSIYGDKTIKLCGKCITSKNLSKDLKNLSLYVKTKDLTKSTFKNYDPETLKVLNKDMLDKIDFKALDLTNDRSTLNLPLIYLPIELFNFNRLTRLHLDGNRIITVPNTLGKNLINLEILTLSNNNLIDLPDSFSNLSKLTSLHLSNNRFQNFPVVLTKIKSIKFLDLSTNSLINIHEDISCLNKLETLLLFQNKLTFITKMIGNLTKLRTLWIGNNKITHLPKQIKNLINLDWDENNFNFSTNIGGNPDLIEPPIEVCNKGLIAITKYFDSLEEK